MTQSGITTSIDPQNASQGVGLTITTPYDTIAEARAMLEGAAINRERGELAKAETVEAIAAGRAIDALARLGFDVEKLALAASQQHMLDRQYVFLSSFGEAPVGDALAGAGEGAG